MKLKRASNKIEIGSLYQIGSGDEMCFLELRSPSAEEMLNVQPCIIHAASVVERFSIEYNSFKLGKTDEPPKTHITVKVLRPLISYIVDHIIEIHGLKDQDTNEDLKFEELSKEDLLEWFVSMGTNTILYIIAAINNANGLDPDIQVRLKDYLNKKDVPLPHTDINWCIAQHRLHIGEGDLPLSSPLWLKQVHEIIFIHKMEEVKRQRQLEEEKEIMRKNGLL